MGGKVTAFSAKRYEDGKLMEQLDFDHGDILTSGFHLYSLHSLQLTHIHSTSSLSGVGGHLDLYQLQSKKRNNQKPCCGVVVPKGANATAMLSIPLHKMDGLYKLRSIQPPARELCMSPTMLEQEQQHMSVVNVVSGKAQECSTFRQNYGIFGGEALQDGRGWVFQDMRFKRPKILMEAHLCLPCAELPCM